MGIFKRIISLIYDRNPIQHSKIIPIFTKHGMYHAKRYKDTHYEYLVFMKQNFFDIQSPIVYVHSDAYECTHLACHCNNQLDLALKMICKENGLVIYFSQEAKKIDTLLQEINTQRLQPNTDIMKNSSVKAGLQGNKKEYFTLGFIFKDLNISKMQLITNDLKVIHSALAQDIEIIKQVPTISFGYGDTSTISSQ